MDAKQDVKLYVYDISNGLARSLSPMLLGRQINGVWHTAIVAYGEEFFYGGIGIQSCRPGGTILGAPTEIVSLGQSELPYDLFLSYLEELSQNSFRGDRYHLFNHNCNTFSNEVANFLTGCNIPSHITNLPQEVLQTPLGTMIKPFVDAMSVGPEGGRALFDGSENSATATAPSHELTTTESSSAAAAEPQTTTSDTAYKLLPVVTYSDNVVVAEFSDRRTVLVDVLCPLDMQLVDEVNEYLSLQGIRDWSIGLAHLKALCRLISDVDIAAGVRQLLASLLQMSLLSDDVISACIHDPDSSFASLAHHYNTFSDELLLALAMCVCNCVSSQPGTDWFVTLCPHTSSSSLPLIVDLCSSWLLSTDVSVRCIAAHIVSNVTRNVQSLSAELALEFGIPLIEACKQPSSESAEHLWSALCKCVAANSQLAELLTAMDLDVSEHERNCPAVSVYAREIRRLVSTDS